MNFWITLIIVILTYIGIAAGSWPKLRVNRTTLTLIGAGLLIAMKQVDFRNINQFIDLDTIILLFSMMVINACMQLSGFFRLAGSTLLRLARTPRAFLAAEIVLSGVLSALFLNDTICLMFTPLILGVTLSAKRNPIPYLIALATAANIGSTATLTGNPQNMIIGIASGISYTDFALALTPVALLGFGGIWLVLVLLYPDEFTSDPFTIAQENAPKVYKPLLVKSLLVVMGMLVGFVAGVPIAEAAFLAACVLLLTRRVHPEKIFAEFDWGLLVFFSGLFVVTGALEVNGVSQRLFSLVDLNNNISAVQLTTLTVALSNLISNVPAVMLLRPFVARMGNPTAGWLTLAAASTLAGNLTLLGSVANLIVAESARRQNVQLTFWEYTRAGFIITIISLAAGVIWISMFVWK
ncbi:MAG: anion transporter [Chloroflexi bacterium]|nr:MAG: anion transporter [Chloroflexota bacterium]